MYSFGAVQSCPVPVSRGMVLCCVVWSCNVEVGLRGILRRGVVFRHGKAKHSGVKSYRVSVRFSMVELSNGKALSGIVRYCCVLV